MDGGLGLVRFSPTGLAITAASNNFLDRPAAISIDNRFSFNVGAGVESRLAERIGLRLAARDIMAPVPRFGVPETSAGPNVTFFPVTGLTHNVEISIGTVFYLTGRSR
jgi:hypothetical protein